MRTRLETPIVAETTITSWRTEAAAVAMVIAGIAFLAARPFALGATVSRTALFATGYAMIGLASLSVACPAERPTPSRASRPTALALGAAAVGLATVVVGAPVPAPWSGATLPLAVLAAVAEEALFRRAAYGRLLRFGAPVAVAVSATLFAVVHVPAYGIAAFPVDLGAGLLLSWQRWASGTWTVPAATHVGANVLAVLR